MDWHWGPAGVRFSGQVHGHKVSGIIEVLDCFKKQVPFLLQRWAENKKVSLVFYIHRTQLAGPSLCTPPPGRVSALFSIDVVRNESSSHEYEHLETQAQVTVQGRAQSQS